MTPSQQGAAFLTLLIKECLRFLRIWVQTVLPAAVTMSLYFLIFGGLIGSQLADIHGLRYMDYIVPGVILMAVINNSYANVVSSFFSAKFQRHVEEMLVSPMPDWLIVAGYTAGGMARGLVVGVAVTAVAAWFTDLRVHSWPVVIAVGLLTTMLFALGGFINALFARSFDDISIIPTFVLTPLTYLGGVFYSIDMLPGFWQQASRLNPVLYMVSAFRYGMHGVADVPLAVSFALIAGFVVVLFAAAVWLLRRGVGVRG